MMTLNKWTLAICLLLSSPLLSAQDDLLSLLGPAGQSNPDQVTNAFKSSRVINGHSMEFIGKGVLDVRILHRFGPVSSGLNNLFGLDQANMRIGLDYGIGRDLTAGLGRSNVGKELDAFLKYRILCQTSGSRSFPISLIAISGITYNSTPWADKTRQNFLSSRMGFYHELIIGRKFSERFSLQVSPLFVHRNLVPLATDDNDAYVLGAGFRIKLSNRVAFVTDYHYIIRGIDKSVYKDPLSVGFDIETGGHVFQLHFSNATGMNEKEFVTNTTGDWIRGEVRFGFNLSRVFTIH